MSFITAAGRDVKVISFLWVFLRSKSIIY
jgi:hypothetical protein